MNIEQQIGQILIDKKLTIATTESCTGGLLSSKLTDISGSSAFVHLNFVTYANEAKHKMLGVSSETLENFGAVSEQCALEMAEGLYKLTKSNICISTTGIAGPTGGTELKPVGLMYSAIFMKNKNTVYKILVDSNTPRVEMKRAFVQKVLENLYELLNLKN